MTMKIDTAPATLATSRTADADTAASVENADHAAICGDSRAANGNANPNEAPTQPAFAAVLADKAAVPQSKTASSLPVTPGKAFTLGADLGEKPAVIGDGKKKGAGKIAGDPKKKDDDADAPVATGTPQLPIDQHALPAIPLTLPGFGDGASLTANEGQGEGAAGSKSAPLPAQLGAFAGLDHVALSLEASAATDARNGYAANSGVHRTAKAISDDQSRIGMTSSESARTYAAIAKATSTTVTHMIHAAATSGEEPRARKAEAPTVRITEAGENKPEAAPRTTTATSSNANGNNSSAGQNDARNPSENGSSRRENNGAADTTDATASADGPTADATAKPGATATHVPFSLPLPTEVHSAAATTKPDALRATFTEDTLGGIERAALSGQQRTDFEVRAFDGTRMAVNVVMKDDKVHVSFAFDAKHTAAEATVRATLGSLESRLGERGLGTVVSFGTLQRSPHEVGVVAATNAGMGGNATANGGGNNNGNGKNQGDQRDQGPSFAEVTELPRTRQAETRTTAKAPTPNGRGGWVA